ncbi:MAG: serine/threonine protein kinase, partial [Pseudomonadota bacterium]
GPAAGRHRALLLEGYQEFRAFDHASLGLIEVLRGLRMVRYTGWIARRWHDPAFPAAWPDFATEEHWRTTTEDLEDQAAIVRGDQTDDAVSDGLTALPPRGETEDVSHLTNKDYFWDWEDEG